MLSDPRRVLRWNRKSRNGPPAVILRPRGTRRRHHPASCLRAGPALSSIPNLITLGRIFLVPIVVWAISSGAMWIAFVLFLAAGVSDAVDGFLAKRFHMTMMLGSYLDPLADKALLVSIYVTLGINGLLPRWLVILVVSRDVMIV